MPLRPPHPCNKPGCGSLTQSRFCRAHTTDNTRNYDHRRGSRHARGYGSRWEKARRIHLAEHPLCAMCERANRVTAATVVDHITPHKGDQGLFWNRDNWQSLCAHCHSSTKQRLEKKSHTTPGGR